jgi:hypothetical protein
LSPRLGWFDKFQLFFFKGRLRKWLDGHPTLVNPTIRTTVGQIKRYYAPLGQKFFYFVRGHSAEAMNERTRNCPISEKAALFVAMSVSTLPTTPLRIVFHAIPPVPEQ